MITPYGVSNSYLPVQSYGPVQYSPNYNGGALFGYNSPYGLYGQNPSFVLAETPYARLTNQPTQLSSTAIPNLSSFIQPMMVDMNAFMGNKTGIPTYPSFIGSTSMMHSDVPLYQTYQDYQQQQQQRQYQQYMQQMQQQQACYPQQGYGLPQQSFGFPQQGFGCPQPNFGFTQQTFGFSQQQMFGIQQINPFMTMSAQSYSGYSMFNNFNRFC